ncbi:RNA-guided endonuclease IscB, partial [Glycomyces salinus]|uniref:RNA-guided endonuclease IscB n=1 Tax=Glycomyces salinus TaxID=980294 RepID=UPI001E50583D
ALESVPADNPEAGTKRGTDATSAPGFQHGRGETAGGSPAIDGVTPAPARAGERPRERHPAVFVLDKHGTPLQPTAPARARKLLKSGRAVVARHTPFVIRMKDRAAGASAVEGVEIGIDSGSKHSGISVFTADTGERRGRFALQIDHRGAAIRKKLAQRSGYRRRRRNVNLRYRVPRFDNRTRPRDWLAPSLRHRVETVVSWVERLSRWAPVRKIHVERVAFDTHAISAGRALERAEYQHGTLHGYEVREYLLEKFGRTCVYCDATDVPVSIDHVHPRSRGGSDRVSNLVLACVPCNQVKGSQDVREFAPNRAGHILQRSKAPLRDAAAVQTTRWVLWRALDSKHPTHIGSGGRTKWNRHRTGVPKSHTLDALHVGVLDKVTEGVSVLLIAGCSGRGSYSRTRPDRHGFPRLRMPRTKSFFGFATGDLVRAAIPSGKHAGIHIGRVAVRSTGSHTVQTPTGPVKTSHRYLRLLQRRDGYAYKFAKEKLSRTPHDAVRPDASSANPASTGRARINPGSTSRESVEENQ